MVDKKETEDLVVKLEISDKKLSEDKPKKYLDVELSYMFEEQNDVINMMRAINTFVEQHSEGFQRANYNVLGYSYY